MDLHLIAKPMAWFTKVNTGFWAVCFSVTWKVVGFAMILFVAALQSIGQDIDEAAMLDNASWAGGCGQSYCHCRAAPSCSPR